jgi:hypothetical protein
MIERIYGVKLAKASCDNRFEEPEAPKPLWPDGSPYPSQRNCVPLRFTWLFRKKIVA